MHVLFHIPGYSAPSCSMQSTLLSADLRPLGHCRLLEPRLIPGHLNCLQSSGGDTPKIILILRG